MENQEEQATVNDIAQSADTNQVEQKTENLPKPDIDLKKWLYSFTIKDKEKEHKFYILKPTRTMKQRGEIEYAKQLGFFVKSGLLPKAAWSTILDNLGGTISESEAKEYENNRRNFVEKTIALEKINQKENITAEDNVELAKLKAEISLTELEMQKFELEQIYIFENTAEAKARNGTIQWWLSEIAYRNENETFLKGNNFDEKMDWYESLDPENENDAIMLRAGRRFGYLITMWFLGRINSWEDFYNSDTENKES